LASSNQEVKVAAVKALGKAGDDTCVKPLVRVLAGPEAAALKKEAVSSLERMKGEKINAEIQACLSSAAGEVRIKLVEILAARRATDAFDAVFQEASQGDPGVRTAAFKALGSLGTGANLPALLRLLTELKGEEGRAEAELAAVRLARKIPEESQQTVAVMTLMKNTSSPTVQASLLRVLGGIANWDALEAMRIALGSKDAEVKETAIQVLAQWPDSRAIDLLLGEWQTARSPAQKSAILRGVVRLLRRGDALPSQTLARYQFLLDGIQRPEDKILVLSGLAEVNHPAALPLVEPLLADPQTRAEAELSMVQIARRVQGSAPLAAQGAAGRLWREAQSEEVRQQAAQLVREIEQCEEFVMTWQVAGPYSRMGGEGLRLLSVPLPPEAEPASVEWRDLPVGSRVERPWMLDLTGILGEGRPRAAYARTWIYMERGQNARMELAVDDPVKVWLNGELVHLHNVALPSVTVASQAGISLKPGWNLLMLKIVQMGGPWEFGVKLLKPDGEPLEGVRFDAAYGERLKTEQIFSRADSGWTQLFNGKDLSGWRQNGDAIFTVENGILLGTQTTGKGGDLFTESEWDNFELRVTYRIVWPANSGFWFRAAGDKGYQFDVLKWKQPVGYSGTLYMPGKLFLTVNLNEGLENRDGWNEACIRARGDELKVWLNGVKVGECRESTHSKGKIGIQVHPGDGFKGMKVMVRTLEIRRIGDK
jgi:HEAT repeat protein